MLSFLVATVLLQNAAIPIGPAKVDVTVSGLPLELYTYKPQSYRGERMIMVFHGVLRNADEYRDHAQQMGERFRALIVAPKFDDQRFPSRKYQYGGIMTADRTAAPKEEWTYSLIPQIVDEVRRMEGRKMPLFIIGHSAGGQFAMRMSAFFDPGAVRIVAANPGSHLFPTRDFPFGYGYGSLPESLSNDDVIKAYLARPLTIYLGTADDHPDEYFDSSENAMKQGAGRFQRGLENFRRAEDLARSRGWKFNWILVKAPMVPHDHEQMFNHPACEKAFFTDYGIFK